MIDAVRLRTQNVRRFQFAAAVLGHEHFGVTRSLTNDQIILTKGRIACRAVIED